MDFSKFELKGRQALVTGANTGIGFGIAMGLAKAGAAVTITGRDKDKCQKAVETLNAAGREECRYFTFDFHNLEGIPEFYEEASEAAGGFDILVNNAGMHCRGRADEIELQDFEEIMKVNTSAPYVLSQCFARERIKRNLPGSIIMIASLMSEATRPNTSPYTATKGAIRQLTMSLAVDWASFGIRVNGIGPGYIHTNMTDFLTKEEDFDKWVKKRTPLGRWGQPEDFEGAAVFLASDASSFVTGQILYVDGGWLATF